MWDFPDHANIQARLGERFQVLVAKVVQGACLALVRHGAEKQLFIFPPRSDLEGLPFRDGLLCPLTWKNARALMSLLPELQPKRVCHHASFGFGDRLGLATPGHIQAMEGSKVFPIFAQQSMRENARTGRTFADVLADAVFGVLQSGRKLSFGADADHLKSVDEAKTAARLGYTFFTCDPSDFLVPVNSLSPGELRRELQKLPLAEIQTEYVGRSFYVPGLGELRFAKEELLCITVKYGQALRFVEEMYQALQEELPQGCDFELSVDETSEPTTEKEHLFLALELRRRGVTLTSLALRLPGVMEKAVDYRGDLEEFRRALRAHVAIARAFGPYRLSLHSGSDKWSIYPLFAQETQGNWHVKTAGTSYLVALEVLTRFSPRLFLEILEIARERFLIDRQNYYVSADPHAFPDFQTLCNRNFPDLFVHPGIRQMLHVTFGSVLKRYGEDLKRELLAHEKEYHEALAQHLGRHLQALGVKSRV